MSDIILNEENLKKMIDALSDAELSEEEKSQFATELTELLHIYSETQKQQIESDRQLIKEKEKLKKAEKGKAENSDTPKIRDKVRILQTENFELNEKLNKLEVTFHKLLEKVKVDKLGVISLTQVSDLKSENAKLTSQVKTILRDYHSLKQTAESLKLEIYDIRAESSHKQREIDLYEIRLSQLTNNLEELTTIKESYKNRLEEQSGIIENLYKTVEESFIENPESPQNLNIGEMNPNELIDALRNALSNITAKADVPKFKGNPPEATAWLDEFESEADACGWTSPEMKLQKVSIYLRDSARDWFKANTFTDWNNFKIQFRAHYMPSSYDFDLKKKLFQTKQSAFEPIVNFVDRKQKYCRNCHINAPEEQIEIILSTMLSEIASRLRPFNIATIEDLISKAKRVEDDLRQNPELALSAAEIPPKTQNYEKNALLEKALKTLESFEKTMKNAGQVRERTENGRPFCTYCRIVGHSFQNCNYRRRDHQRNINFNRNNNYNVWQNRNPPNFNARLNNQRGNFNGNRNPPIYNANSNTNLPNRQSGNSARNSNNNRGNANSALDIEYEVEEQWSLSAKQSFSSIIKIECFVENLRLKALLDTGASMTMISKKLADMIGKPLMPNEGHQIICANLTLSEQLMLELL